MVFAPACSQNTRTIAASPWPGRNTVGRLAVGQTRVRAPGRVDRVANVVPELCVLDQPLDVRVALGDVGHIGGQAGRVWHTIIDGNDSRSGPVRHDCVQHFVPGLSGNVVNIAYDETLRHIPA